MEARRIGLLGATEAAQARRRSLERLGCDVLPVEPRDVGRLDVLFVATAPADRYAVACEAVRQGVPVFVEWPPAPALSEVQALVAAAEEAGVAVGVSRPLRGCAGLQGAAPARLVLVQRTLPPGVPLLTAHTLADLADLCRFLAASTVTTRLEAHVERDAARVPQAVAFALRFQNGAYAQASVLPGAEEALSVQAHTGADVHAAHLHGTAKFDGLLDEETGAFLAAVEAGRAAPVPPLDALQTLRLVEKLWGRLR